MNIDLLILQTDLLLHNASLLKYSRTKAIPRVQQMVSHTCALEGHAAAKSVKKSEFGGHGTH